MSSENSTPESERDVDSASNAARAAAIELMAVMLEALPSHKAEELNKIVEEGGHLGIEITMSGDGTGGLSLVAVCADETRLVVSTIISMGSNSP